MCGIYICMLGLRCVFPFCCYISVSIRLLLLLLFFAVISVLWLPWIHQSAMKQVIFNTIHMKQWKWKRDTQMVQNWTTKQKWAKPTVLRMRNRESNTLDVDYPDFKCFHCRKPCRRNMCRVNTKWNSRIIL